MQVHKGRNYGTYIDWMTRCTTVTTTVLAAMVVSTSPANASSVSGFFDKSYLHADRTDYFNFSINDYGASSVTTFHKEQTDKVRKVSSESGDGHIAIAWGNRDSTDTSRNEKGDDGNSNYTPPHEGIHGDFSWVLDYDKFFNHDKSEKTHHEGNRYDSRDDRDHHDFLADKDNHCKPPAPVPVPAAIWLFGSGLAGLLRLISRRPRQ